MEVWYFILSIVGLIFLFFAMMDKNKRKKYPDEEPLVQERPGRENIFKL